MAFQPIDEYPIMVKRNGCIGCGSPRRQGERLVMFDQMVDEIIDADGNVHSATSIVICESCIVELAVMVDCLTPLQATRLRNENTDLARRLTEAEAGLGTKTDLMEALGRLTELAGDLAPEPADV